MASKVIRKEETDFTLFAPVGDAGSFSPSVDIASLMADVEEAENDGRLDDYEEGIFWAISELLSTPLGLLEAKAQTMLEGLLVEAETNAADDAEEAAEETCELPEESEQSVVESRRAEATHTVTQTPITIGHNSGSAIMEGDLTDEETLQQLVAASTSRTVHAG